MIKKKLRSKYFSTSRVAPTHLLSTCCVSRCGIFAPAWVLSGKWSGNLCSRGDRQIEDRWGDEGSEVWGVLCRGLWEQDTPTQTGAARKATREPSVAEILEDGGWAVWGGGGFHAGTDGDNVLILCLCDPIVFSFLTYFFLIYYYY